MALSHQVYSADELVADLELGFAWRGPTPTRTSPSEPAAASTESALESLAPYLNNYATIPAALA
jgi:hypothetical protein